MVFLFYFFYINIEYEILYFYKSAYICFIDVKMHENQHNVLYFYEQ
jgi:hypothetical protein